jgi:hypothetical protein
MYGQPMVKVWSNPTQTLVTLDVFWNFCRVLQISPKHLKIYRYKSCAELPGTHFIFRMALLVLSGKGFKLPRKVRITVHRDMDFSQLGTWISPSNWTKFKFGFSQVLEGSPIYNFPIYGFWNLFAIFRESCKETGAHRSDRAVSVLRRDVACARHHTSPTRHRRAPSYHERYSEFRLEHGVHQHRTHLQAASRPKSPRATRRARTRRGAVDPPASHARRGSPYPAL